MKYQGKIQDPLDLVTKQYVDNREVTESTVSGWGFTKNTGTVTTTGTMTSNHVVVSNGTTVIKDSGYTIAKSVPSDAVFTDTTYESKSAASGGTDVSLVTTGEKYTWNNKGSYSKPSGGIPSSDMASAVQSSLSKADTAVQPEAGKGLFSGNYNDLTNKPTIPPAVTETTVSDWGFTKNTGTYSRPSDGIPKTDLASAVQTSLGRADTALQSYTETDPVFSASAAAGITSSDISTWNAKGTYSKPSTGIPKTDLASAVQTSLGLADTALQSFSETDPTVPSWAKQPSKPTYTKSEVGLGNVGNFKAVSTVASQGLTDAEKSNARTNIGAGTSNFSGSYNDLTNKPTIPSALSELSDDSTHRTVTDEEKSTWNGKGTYSKPSGGIPKTDLDSAVQASLDKADSALQSAPVNSVNNKTGAVNLTASDVGADSAGTAAGLINALDFTSPSASGNDISFIDTVSQSDGEISATKKTVRSASTSQTGVVQLNDTVTSTSTTQAATANAVKQAYNNGGVQSVNGQTGNVTVDVGSSYHLYTGVLDADNWTELADGHFQQSITISGVLGSDMPILDVDITAGGADVDTQMNREDEWTAFRGWTENNLLTVILLTLPPIDIPIKLLCFRQ